LRTFYRLAVTVLDKYCSFLKNFLFRDLWGGVDFTMMRLDDEKKGMLMALAVEKKHSLDQHYYQTLPFPRTSNSRPRWHP
jgi:hypothetical protein